MHMKTWVQVGYFHSLQFVTPYIPGEERCEDDGSKQVAEGNHVGLLVPCDKLNDTAENVNALDSQFEHINSSICSDFPAPEKLLSVPEVDARNNVSMGASPAQISAQNDGSNDTNVTITGKKRSFAESSLTMQSFNSVDSSAIVRHETAPKSVPGDDDLLSSILGKVKAYRLHRQSEALLRIAIIMCLVFLNVKGPNIYLVIRRLPFALVFCFLNNP